MSDKLQTICLDFDGVIHPYSKGWHDGTIYDPPTEGTEEFLNTMLDNYNVVISSARHAVQVYHWLIEQFPEIDFQLEEDKFWYSPGSIGVTNIKPVAIAYVDDRAIPFVSYDLVIEMLDVMEEDNANS